MRLMCAKRDALWGAYDRALKAYILAVDTFFGLGGAHALDAVREALATLNEARAKIKSHCDKHNCDGDGFFQRS